MSVSTICDEYCSLLGTARHWKKISNFDPKTSQSCWNCNISHTGYCYGLIEMGENGGVDLQWTLLSE